MHLLKKITCILTGGILTSVAMAASCYYSSATVNHAKYPVFGVDVSNYQGIIDWKRLESQNVSFAFIKATEGSGHVDESARRNLRDAAKTDIKLSAYHFFSFDSPGETQAANFISVVSRNDIDMPPVVDVEYYADKKSNKPSCEEAEAILKPLLDDLEEYYGKKPILYTTLPVYCRYIRESFGDYPLWIRSVNMEPDLLDWKFWQYCDSGCLDGYEGDEECIDFNVYNGSMEEFIEEYGGENDAI